MDTSIIELVKTKSWSTIKAAIEKSAAANLVDRVKVKKEEILSKLRGN